MSTMSWPKPMGTTNDFDFDFDIDISLATNPQPAILLDPQLDHDIEMSLTGYSRYPHE